MKKLLAFTAIVVIAATTQATNIKWGINSGALDTSLFADGSAIYLMQGSSFAYDGDLSTQTSFSIEKVTGGNIVHNADGDITGTLASGVYKNDTGVSVTPAASGIAQGFKPFFLVVISADGNSIAYSSSSNVNVAASAMSGSVYSTAGNFTVATAVPEPTTVALLALGLAAVGLKRKVA